MKFTISAELLWSLTQRVVGILERRQKLPVLNNILIEASAHKLRLIGSDSEHEVVAEASIPIVDTGALTVPGRRFTDITRSLSGMSELDIAQNGDKLIVRCGRSRYSLPTIPAVEFPSIGDVSCTISIPMQAAALRRLLAKTAFAMAQQDVRFFLNGLLLHFEKGSLIRAVATDGHRLAFSEFDWQPSSTSVTKDFQVIIPRKAVFEILRTLSAESDEMVDVGLADNFIQLRQDGQTFTAKLIDARYPDYERVIPVGNEKLIKVERQVFKEALARTSVVCTERFRGIRMTVEKNLVRFSASNSEREEAEEEVAVMYDGAPIEVAFNATYLNDAVSAIDDDEMYLELGGAGASCLLYGNANKKTKYVVMPIRL